MKTILFNVLWCVVLGIMFLTGIFSFIMLVGEADDWATLLATKVIAIAGFIVTYWLYKWLSKAR